MFNKRLFLTIWILALFSLFFSEAIAVNPGHPAGELDPGIFQSGTYEFPGIAKASQFCIGSSCKTAWWLTAITEYTNIAMINQSNIFQEDTFFQKNIYINGELISINAGSLNGSIYVSKDNLFNIGNSTDAFKDIFVYNLARNTTASDSFVVTNTLKTNKDLIVNGVANITGGGGKEGIFVNSAGQVGIGIASPDVALHIKSLVDGYTEVKLDGRGVNGDQWTIGTGYLGESLNISNFYWYNNDAPYSGVKMVLNPEGYLGLGENKPSARLVIYNTTSRESVPYLNISSAGVAAPHLFVDASGRVGIGAVPDETLKVQGNAKIAGSAYASQFYVGYGGTAAIYTQDTDEDLTIDPNGAGDTIILGKTGINTTTPTALLEVGGSPATMIPLALNVSNVLVVNGSRVGVGVAGPRSALEVSGDVNASGVSAAQYCLGSNCITEWGATGGGSGASPWTYTGTNIHPNATFLSGNVGIGTTAPTAKLDVNGLINASNFNAIFDNTTVGYMTGFGNNASRITAFGYQSGMSNTAAYLTALGFQTGYGNNGTGSTLVGYTAGRWNSGPYMTAIGNSAGESNNGTQVVVMGYNAGFKNTGNYLTALGTYAGYGNNGSLATILGYNAGYDNTAPSVVLVGYNAGNYNNGTRTTVVGESAGYRNTGNYLTAIGYNSGYFNNGSDSTFVGYTAGSYNNASRTTGVGYGAGYRNTGTYLTALGFGAGYGNNGSNVVAIGYQAGYDNTRANQFILKQGIVNSTTPLIQGDFATMRVGIGTDTPSHTLTVPDWGTVNLSSTLFVTGGKVGIGEAKPSAPLVVKDSGVIDMNVSNNLFVNATSVGVGTATPAAKFEINSGGMGSALLVKAAEGTNRMLLWGTSDTGGATLDLYNSVGTSTTRINGDANGNTYFNSGGNVGISETVPTSRLVIAGDVNASGGVSATQYCLGSNCITEWGATGGGSGASPWTYSGTTVMLNNTFTAMNVSNMLFAGASGVGVGTATPTSALAVTGDINASGQIKASNFNAGSFNLTAVGFRAGESQSGTRVTQIGYLAGGYNNVTYQTAVGYQAGYSNYGESQSAFGYSAGYQNTGSAQSVFGASAGQGNTGSAQSVFGASAGQGNTGSAQSVFGYAAGQYNTGHKVIGVGYEATRNNTGSDVVAIGYLAGQYNNVSNQLIIQQSNLNGTPLIQGNFATMKLGIGTNSPSHTLTVPDWGTVNLSSTFFVTGGKVGVGNATPTSALTVAGNINATGDVRGNRLCIGSVCQDSWSTVSGGSGNSPWTYSGTNVYPNSTFVSGNVGVGLSVPTSRLHVNDTGTAFAIGNTSLNTFIVKDGMVGVGTSGPKTSFEYYGSSANIVQMNNQSTGGALMNLRSNFGTNPLLQITGTSTADLLRLNDDATTVFVVKDGGNVGIGTASPTQTLNVIGAMNATLNITTDRDIKIHQFNKFYLGNCLMTYNGTGLLTQC